MENKKKILGVKLSRKSITILVVIILVTIGSVGVKMVFNKQKISPDLSVSEIPPRYITGEITSINDLKMQIQVTQSQIDSVKIDDIVNVDFSKTIIGNTEEYPTDESRKKEIKKYQLKQKISIACSHDQIIDNQTIYLDSPFQIN